jgi:hypothetical protein
MRDQITEEVAYGMNMAMVIYSMTEEEKKVLNKFIALCKNRGGL